MAVRKKPEGKDWQEFIAAWTAANHDEKLELAAKYGVTYDTTKHWVSEGDTTPTQLPLPEATLEDKELDEARREVLAMRPLSELKFASFDIETSNLNADFSVLLCACLKPYGEATKIWRSDKYKAWGVNRADDREIVADIAEELGRYAVIVTHYGSKFDIPYMRAKMVSYGMPPLPPLFGMDTYMIAKPSFKVSSRRLANLARYFEVGSKSGVDGKLWMQAAYAAKDASTTAMDEIVAHCVVDVEVLERVASISFPYARSLRRI